MRNILFAVPNILMLFFGTSFFCSDCILDTVVMFDFQKIERFTLERVVQPNLASKRTFNYSSRLSGQQI